MNDSIIIDKDNIIREAKKLYKNEEYTEAFNHITKNLHSKSSKEIAELLGISQQYYSEYENGKRTIPIQHLITLAKYYNTSIDYIVGLSDTKDITESKKKIS